LIKNIPNIFTIANLILGFICILNVFVKNDFEIIYVFYFCLILDFLDGFSARKLSLTSEFGKQIDSLADLVSFGILPSVILYDYFDSNSLNLYLKYSSVLILVSSSIRLARFNISEDNNYFFVGLPTPANALFFISLIYYQGNLKVYFDENVILALIILFSFLMVSNLKFISFKISNFTLNENIEKLILILLGIIIIILQGHSGLFLLIFLYVSYCIIKSIISTLFLK
tara:strand:- start:91 stop:774 length:684 start_codon:yes stop_codon:yes gene_type:complete